MRPLGLALALAGVLASASAGAAVPASGTAKALQHTTAAVTKQRAEVDRLQQNVAAQEGGSREAARQLDQKDAQIAELQRQLRAVDQAGAGKTGRH